MKKELIELELLLEELYESNDDTVWKAIFYRLEKLKELVHSN